MARDWPTSPAPPAVFLFRVPAPHDPKGERTSSGSAACRSGHLTLLPPETGMWASGPEVRCLPPRPQDAGRARPPAPTPAPLCVQTRRAPSAAAAAASAHQGVSPAAVAGPTGHRRRAPASPDAGPCPGMFSSVTCLQHESGFDSFEVRQRVTAVWSSQTWPACDAEASSLGPVAWGRFPRPSEPPAPTPCGEW